MDAPLALPQPAGAAAAHQPVPEDEEGGEHGNSGVQDEDDADDVLVGYMLEIGMEPVYFREDEFYNFCVFLSDTMMQDTMMVGMMIKQHSTTKNLEWGHEEI